MTRPCPEEIIRLYQEHADRREREWQLRQVERLAEDHSITLPKADDDD